MSKVRIVTDSTADIPKEIVEELGILVVPLKIHFGGEVYRDGADIKTVEFIERLNTDQIQPTTSQPSPGEFVALYEQLISRNETIISIHLSGKLSGTVQSARTAKTMLDSKDIYIIDSNTVSMGLGLLVMAAARAASQGCSVREILSLINNKIENSFVFFMVDTLDYLEKGGRIGKASAFLGTLLKIKPILAVEDGQIVPVERARGKNKALDRVVQIISGKSDQSKVYECSIVYGNDYTSVVMLRDNITKTIKCNEPIIAELGPVVMAHAGPGVIGVVLCPE